MRTFSELPTVRRALPDGNIIEFTPTDATHIFARAVNGFTYRGKIYHATAHLYLQKDGSWAWGAGGSHSALYCHDAPPTYKAKIRDAFITLVNAVMQGPDGRGVRRMAEIASCNNEIQRLEKEQDELQDKLREIGSKISTLNRKQFDAEHDILPDHYEEKA